MTSVFLSYARQDDKAFVARVHATLVANGFTVWWDRLNMPARGIAFPEEIRDAIHRCERFVVVIGPAALRSAHVRAEWQAALSEGKPVVTLLRRAPDGVAIPHDCLPAELKVFHAEDFIARDGREPPLDPLLRLLSDLVPPPPKVHGLPPERPPHFLPRPDEFSALFDAVLGETTRPEVQTHADRITVLSGMGGIGKTVLAASLVAAVCSRPSTFVADGIYWLDGEPLRKLAALCELGLAGLGDTATMTEALARHLEHKRFLLVVDDVTSAAQIAPLTGLLGAGGRMLVTTRDGELAVGHRPLQLDALSDDQALQLVADWVGIDAAALPPAARELVELCGRHPFAIALNAAAIGQGLPWTRVIEALRLGELGYAAHKFKAYDYRSVEASLAVSIAALPPVDRARCRELAAFIWDGGVPAAAILRLWRRHGGLPEHHGDRLLVQLRQRSLLQLDGAEDRRRVRLHPLLIAFIARNARRTVVLGRALLASYRPSRRRPWWRVADDGYIHGKLLRHLMRARAHGSALALIAAEDATGGNAWYRVRRRGDARDGGDGLAGYVADIDLVIDETGHCLPVLIAASLRSLARAVPGGMLGAAVHHERWSIEHAAARARLFAEPAKRAHALIALLPRMQPRAPWLADAMAAIAASDPPERRKLVEALAPLLAESELLATLRQVVAWIGHGTSPYERTQTLPAVHPILDAVPPALAAEAFAIVAAIEVRPVRLYGALPEPARSAHVAAALDEFRHGDDDRSVWNHAYRVGVLAPHLEPTAAAAEIAAALSRVRRLEPGIWRFSAHAMLLGVLAGDEQERVFDELLAEAGTDRALLVELARATPPALYARIQDAIADGDAGLIADVAPLLAGAPRRTLVDRVLGRIEAGEVPAWLLTGRRSDFVAAMDADQLRRAHRLIDAGLDGMERIRALAALAHASAEPERGSILPQLLEAIDALTQADQREQARELVAPLLTSAALADALQAAERIGEPSGLEHLVKLLPHLAAPARRRASERVARHAGSLGRAALERALGALPEGAGIGPAAPLVEVALRLDDGAGRARLLVALATRMIGTARRRTSALARAAIERVGHAGQRCDLLLRLGEVDAAAQALEQVGSEKRAGSFVHRVARLAPRLEPARAAQWLDAALRRHDDDEHAVETLAPCLPARLALGFLVRTLRARDNEARARLLQAIASNRDLPPIVVASDAEAATAGALARRLGELGESKAALEILRLGRDDAITALALAELAPWLSRADVLLAERVVAAVATMDGQYVPSGPASRVNVGMGYLGARLAPALARVGAVDRALALAERASDPWQLDAYLTMAPATVGRARSAILTRALATALARREVAHDERLDALARAIAREPAIARAAWKSVCAWARTRPRDEAIAILCRFVPVAATAGGPALAGELFIAIDRALRWWP